jgi:hypothetical protein
MDWGGGLQGGMGLQGSGQRLGLEDLRGRHLRCATDSYPNQDAALLICGEFLGVDEFVLEILQIVVVQSELPLYRSIRDSLLALEPGDDLGQTS